MRNLLLAFLLIALPAQAADVFTYSFETTAKNQTDNGNTADPDAARSDVQRHGDETTSNGRGWQVIADANYSSGAGGLGFRTWRGDGTNSVSGGINFILPTGYNELWVRFYMRYQSGFAWTGGNPSYTKDIYGNTGGNYWIYGKQGTGWGVTDISSPNHSGAYGWSDLMGGDTGDGQWHCHEFHISRAGAGAGVIEVWIDGTLRHQATGLTLSSGTMSELQIGENQTTVTGAGANDYYTDYDDFVISDSGRVGCIAASSGPCSTGNCVRIRLSAIEQWIVG